MAEKVKLVVCNEPQNCGAVKLLESEMQTLKEQMRKAVFPNGLWVTHTSWDVPKVKDERWNEVRVHKCDYCIVCAEKIEAEVRHWREQAYNASESADILGKECSEPKTEEAEVQRLGDYIVELAGKASNDYKERRNAESRLVKALGDDVSAGRGEGREEINEKKISVYDLERYGDCEEIVLRFLYDLEKLGWVKSTFEVINGNDVRVFRPIGGEDEK